MARQKVERLSLKCSECGKKFLRKQTDIYGKLQFCSVKCHNEFRKTKQCKICGSAELFDQKWKINIPVCNKCYMRWRKERQIKSSKQTVRDLPDSYIKALLRFTGILFDESSKELFQIKRQQVLLRREIRKLKEEINGSN